MLHNVLGISESKNGSTFMQAIWSLIWFMLFVLTFEEGFRNFHFQHMTGPPRWQFDIHVSKQVIWGCKETAKNRNVVVCLYF
jgi:hypothetical protein